MPKWLLPFLLVVLLLPGEAQTSFLHAPHNETNGISCQSCHEYPLAGGVWPGEFPPASPTADDTFSNFICLRCHDGSNPQAPAMALHSSLVVQGSYNFTTECVSCHDPHFQAQLQWALSYPDQLYLVTGRVIDVIPQDNTTVIRYAGVQAAANWQDPAAWGAKSGAGRGLIFIADAAAPDRSYEVIAATATEITLNGVAPMTFRGNVFGLIYGQLIHYRISREGVARDRAVKFFDPTTEFVDGNGNPAAGGFVDRNNATPPQGICQICHTQTIYFRTDVSEPDANHPPDTSVADCSTCHQHEAGFKAYPTVVHGPGQCSDGFAGCSQCHKSGRHASHMDIRISCKACHNTCLPVHDASNNVLFKDGNGLADTTVCAACHRNPTTGGGANQEAYKAGWADGGYQLGCDGCHDGRPFLDARVMSSNGHERLVGEAWIRRYPCTHCHADSVDSTWHLKAAHANGTVDVVIDPKWNIAGGPAPSYTPAGMTCNNLYCHSDGTAVNPETRPVAWSDSHWECNMCHGHDPAGTSCNSAECHSDGRDASYWNKMPESRWLTAMPMYRNSGPGTARANSHARHLFTGLSCDDCHAATVQGGSCLDCHSQGIPAGAMNETAHVNGTYHVNGTKDVVFKSGGTFNPVGKTCSGTACHTGFTPQWGDTVDNVACRDCHGTTGAEVDDFGDFNGVQAKINLGQWQSTGHGRPLAAGNYPQSGNPPADFPEKGCWYCHDNNVLHQDEGKPFRLIEHDQFRRRFDKECVFCHMNGQDEECLGCHNDAESLGPQLATIGADPQIHPPYAEARQDHAGYVDGDGNPLQSCTGCHTDDAHRHKTGNTRTWSNAEKEDIKNNYVNMGVCLKCHDDDSSGECSRCHQGPQYVLGFDPGLEGTRFITAVKAKATSMHFGYKHYLEYEASVVGSVETGTASATSPVIRQLIDASKNWGVDSLKGRYLYVTGGVHAGLNRLIVANDATSLRVDRAFPGDVPVAAGDTYEIKDALWKGGKFCWDCHDPHGDNNIYMIQDQVATRTDGWAGRPLERKAVSFTRKQSGLDYARTAGPSYNGICNVCHTDPSQHYGRTWGDGHNASRVCTSCHEHRFTDSHSSGQDCNSCHGYRPVPRHSGFSLPRDCVKCHAGTIGKRMNIMGQFSANSHHVQGVEVDGKKCYACHWEATELGLIDLDHHQGYNYKTHQSIADGQVDLVIWNGEEAPGVDDDPLTGGRPSVYDPDGSDPANTSGQPTVTAFTAAAMAAGIDQERQEVEKITPHCLSCHSDQNNDTVPFDDCRTPRQYAWDRQSIASRYSDAGTTPWGKYPQYPGAAPRNFTKAFSAHGNATQNEGGYDPANGLDGDLQGCDDGNGNPVSCSTRSGVHNVQCFDCHSSHGSKVVGTTTSYLTFNNTYNGGNFKETQAGKGGYAMTYKASANPNPNSPNPYQAGAGQCFDCHETENRGATPWGYKSTFGAETPIMGYEDSARFGGGPTGVTLRSPYKKSSIAGGHFKASSSLDNAPMATINGLCTPCHDPHGISRSLGDGRRYAVPLLKGTWLTSPYKEDTANDDGVTGERCDQAGCRSSAVGPAPVPYVYTDQKTFGTDRISEDPAVFAGLCLTCHPKEKLTNETQNESPWKSRDRVHEAVKGWGDNQMHSYSCSKCHRPHSSALPRLMRTNCLNTDHRGQVISGGAADDNQNLWRYDGCSRLQSKPSGFPNGMGTNGNLSKFRVNCHPTGTWPDNSWNEVTPW
ncbi:MAG: CxxxxCH/CxxCH domain-containing protein [Thermodesulfobacteriota bacterium]